MENLFDSLDAAAGPGCVVCDAPMSAHTTFRVGGPADYVVSPKTLQGVCDVVSLCRTCGLPLHVLGHGSNVLVSDAGVRGVVLKISSNLSAVELGDAGEVVAQAGASNSKVASLAQREGLSGYEFAAGIPGTVGGAAIMNAGAYDGEFKQVAQSVTCLDAHGCVKEASAAQAAWGYRTSAFMADGSIVLYAKLKLAEGDPDVIRARMDELAERRRSKQPIELPSAGSTFKRPEGHFAGKLIQDAGMQGYRVGGAQVSPKHAGFVVNVGGATAADVKQVIDDVRRAVLVHSGVELRPEVRLWGFDGPSDS